MFTGIITAVGEVREARPADGGLELTIACPYPELVLGESIGDLAGARIAYRAFKKSLEGKPAPPSIDGFTPEQQFFIAWGQFRGDEIRPETQRLMVQTDPHPTAKYRVMGPLSNMREFQRAFGCAPTSPMVRSAEDRCEVW